MEDDEDLGTPVIVRVKFDEKGVHIVMSDGEVLTADIEDFHEFVRAEARVAAQNIWESNEGRLP